MLQIGKLCRRSPEKVAQQTFFGESLEEIWSMGISEKIFAPEVKRRVLFRHKKLLVTMDASELSKVFCSQKRICYGFFHVFPFFLHSPLLNGMLQLRDGQEVPNIRHVHLGQTWVIKVNSITGHLMTIPFRPVVSEKSNINEPSN